MICNICGKNEAVVNIVRVENGVPKEMYICKDCIEERLKEDLNIMNFFDQGLNQFFANIFNLYDDVNKLDENKILKHLNDMDLDIYDLKYEKNVDSKTRIADRTLGERDRDRVNFSAENAEEVSEENRLRELLEDAIKKEEYEQAAVLRDKIKDLCGDD